MVRQRETCEPALRADDDRAFEAPSVDSPPSPVQVLIQQTERATYLAALTTLGPKVDALSRIPTQHSACWALGRARRHAVPAETARRLARKRNAVTQIRQAGSQFPSLGTRLFAFAKAKPIVSPEEGWALIWQTHHEAKAQRATSTPQSRLSPGSALRHF
jgi:hypothetical protein